MIWKSGITSVAGSSNDHVTSAVGLSASTSTGSYETHVESTIRVLLGALDVERQCAWVVEQRYTLVELMNRRHLRWLWPVAFSIE